MKRLSLHKRKSVATLFLFLVVGFADRSLPAADGVTLLYDDIRDSNDQTFHDKSIRVDYRQAYAVGFLGDWQRGGEAGGYLLDSRRSAYGGYVRVRRGLDQTYQLDTDQVLSKGYVAKLEGRYVHVLEPEPGEKANLFVYGLGFDKYYGDYNYFSAMYYNDPRKARRFSVVLSNTLATLNNSLRIGLVPRSDHKLGYFATAKYHWVFIGYSFTRNFDFATFDRRNVTVGLQVPLDLRWSRGE